MRVALICPTVGQTRRGYERFVTDLFHHLGDAVEMTLFKGGGESREREKVLPHFRRTSRLNRVAPNRLRHARYQLEFASYALVLVPHLLRQQFDVVHFIDPPLGRLLGASRRLAHAGFRLLFTNAGPTTYDCSRWADHTHCLTPGALEGAKRAGLDPERLSLLPVGIDPEGFSGELRRDELRRRMGVAEDAFVVLSVTSLNRLHKRVDYLIDEVASLEGRPVLWIDGSTHPDGDPALLDLARRRLGDRFRHTHVPSDQVGDLYRLADVMVSTSLHESFGMAVVEAMSCGTPVLAHDSAHFRWLIGGTGHLLDMSRPGALASRLAELRADPGELRRGRRDEAVERFGWTRLKAGYVEMYRAVAAIERQPAAPRST